MLSKLNILSNKTGKKYVIILKTITGMICAVLNPPVKFCL